MSEDYPHLERFSRKIGIPKDNLIRAFRIEREFHSVILKETDREARKQMYNRVYNTVHPIYGTSLVTDEVNKKSHDKDKIVKLFRKELVGKSILDLGCGLGHFLMSVDAMLDHKRLVGIDTSIDVLPENKNIDFICSDIISFDLKYKFDVIFSDNVMEHIAPMDLPLHLSSIRNALSENGTLIVIMPNRLFGPGDVTRIIDCTYTNRIKAMGTHLNESTYTEMISILKKIGFNSFQTVLPIPIIKYYLPNIRISTKLLKAIENKKMLLNIMYKLNFIYPIFTLPIILICRRVSKV